MPAPKFRMRGTTAASETEATQKKTSTAPKFRMRGAGGGTSPSLPTVTSQAVGETTGRKKARRPTTAGKLGKITSPVQEAESRAEELRTLRDEAHQEFLNFRGAEITAGAAGTPTEPYTGRRYRTAEEAYQAWQDYDRQYTELRNRYYVEENEQQQARLAQDTSMQASFARADGIRDALNRIQSLEQTRGAAPGPLTEEAVSQAVREIAGQYGLSQEDSRNLTAVRKALEGRLLEETDRISAAGYDYERMTEYQRRQERAAEAEQQRQQTAAWAGEHPVLASLASVGASALRAVDIPRLIATGGGSGDDLGTYTPADPNAAIISNFVTGVRDTVSKKIEKSTDWDLFGQNVASFLYNTGMSIGDSASQVALLGPWATYLMGASAASQQAVNVLERGGSNSQAFWGGLAAGAAEAVFERFSIEKLLEAKTINSVKDLLRATARQAGTEASEEMLTEIANILSDTAIMGESSDFEQLVAQYQLMGMDEDEARKQAYLDSVAQVVWAGVGGALSGAAMGGGLGGVDLAGRNIRQRQQQTTSRAIDAAYDTMQREGLFSPAARQATEQAQQRSDAADRREARAYNNNYMGRPQRQASRDSQAQQDEQGQAQAPQNTQAAVNVAELEQSAAAAGVAEADVRAAAEISRATGREIRFYDGTQRQDPSGRANGYFDGDTIYVNSRSANPVAQIISHELTHSVEMADAYRDLSSLVFDRIQKTGGDLERLRQEKQAFYAQNGKLLRSQKEVDQEIVAEYVEHNLLTSEQEILELTREKPTLAQRIMDWIDQLLAKLGNSSARERDFLTTARNTYARALEQTRTTQEAGRSAQQTAAPAAQAAPAGQQTERQTEPQAREQETAPKQQTDSAAEEEKQRSREEIRQEIRALREDLSAGRISDEEFDEALDAIMEEEGLEDISMLNRYSFGGENARRADLEALDRAQDMERRNVAMDTIFRETGWFQGTDGKWRFEIDDSGMEYDPTGDLRGAVSRQWAMEDLEAAREDLFGSITEEQADMVRAYNRAQIAGDTAEQQRLYDELTSTEFGFLFETYADALQQANATRNNPQGGTLGDYIDHPELFANYPQLRQAGLRFADLPDGTYGTYNTETNTIMLDNSLRSSPEDTLVHEIQHAIQTAEGFAGGSSPEYWRTPREAAIRPEYRGRIQETRERLREIEDRFRQEWPNDTINLENARAYYAWDDLYWKEESQEGQQRYLDRMNTIEEAAREGGWEDLLNEYYAARAERDAAISAGMDARRTPYDAYFNTAGEIEARDAAQRRQMTPEQRRQTMPNTGDENTVFADNFGNSFSAEAAEPVDSQAFKDWFGDWTSDRADHSQVVDGQGRPLIVYHGTGTSIEEFLPEFTGQGNDQYGSGFYFTTDRETAEGYTTRTLNDQGKPGGMDNPNVIPAYLNIRNPLVVEARDTPNLYQIEVPASQAVKIIEKMPDIMDLENSILGDFFDDYWESGPKRSMINRLAREYDWTLGTLATDIFRDHPTEYRQAVRDVLGYDGVQVNFPSGEKHFIAWFPNQIKHATENSGAFSPNDNRIRYSISEPTDAQQHPQGARRIRKTAEPSTAAQDEAERLLFQGVDADTIREMTGLERTEDHGWRFTVDTTPEAAYDGGRTTDQQGGLDDGQNEYDLRGVHGENVRRREAGETIPGRPRSAQRRNAAGSQTDEGGRRAAPASWARGRVIDRPSRAAGIAAENAGRYGADAFVVEDAAIKERNPKAWALTSGGSIYISDSIPAELADVVGYHEAIHAAKQTGNDRYLDFLENTGEYISLSSDRTAEVMGMIIKQRFHGSKSLFDLTPQEQTTAFDELNAVVWGFHKADQENAREQFADMFQDYDAYIADLDAAMESGAEPEVPGLSLPTLDDEDIRYSMDEDTAAEPSDNPPLSPDQSGRSDLHRPRGMSDEQYNRLNERWKNRPVDWRETLAPEGFDSIDDYTAALEAAAEERMRNRSREEFEGSDALKDLGIRIANSVGLYGNTQQLIENDRAAKSIRKEIKRAERRLQATDAEKNFASGVAAGIYGEADIPPSMDADTVMELADYYWAEKAVQNDLIREQRTKINRNLDERVRRLMDGVDDAKTKVPAAVIMRNRTPERNMRRIFGNAKGDEINDYLFRPVQDNEAERIRFVNRMHNEVRTFKDRNGKDRRLNKEERALVQLVIEGRAAEDAVNAMERSRDIQNAAENIKNARKLAGKDDLAKRRQAEIDASVDEAREFNLGTDERRLAIQYSRWLETQERLQGADTTIIGNAVEKYRELFNQLYDAANDFLVAHGYEPIGFIRGYAPHLQSQETQERFNNALERMGINREIGKLPTSIAGRTKNFKPNMPWNGFFKNRNSQGEFLDPDIAEGFEKYVDSMSDVLYHTDDIMRTRAFVRYFRRTYAPEEIRNQLEQADALRYAQADQQASFLRDKGKLSYTSAPTYEDVHQAMEQYVEDQYQAIENLTLYGDLAVFLDDYANNLANKQLFEDRAMEKSFGRTSLNAISKVHRAFARAQVSANLSSALNQGGQLPIILAENGARNVAQALIELRSKDLKSWAAGSDFLTEKKGINYIVTSWKDRAITGAFKPLEIVDGIVSTLAVRSRYLKEVRAGKSAAEAMRLADRFGREVMASRAKGSVPLAFRSKDFLNQMVHMFQLEALNNWEHVIQDLGNRDFREMARAKGKRAAAGSLAAVLVKIILGAFLLNRIDEELYGGTPAPFDVLGLAGNLFAGGLGLTQMDLLRTLVDNVWERLTGERLFDTDPELNEFDAAAGWDDFVWNGLNEIPFASNVAALAGMGDRTLPMPDLSNLADLPGTIAEDGLFSWEVARQLAGLAGDVLPGGRQIEKSIQGGEALLRGGYYRGSGENRRLQFPVEQDFWSIVRGILFGQSALDESRDFYASGQTGLSANQTKAYEQIVDMGADPETVYQAIQGWRAAENDEALNSYGRGVAKRDAITEADLTDEQKLALYRGLSDADSSTPDHFRAMMDTGLSWEEVMEAYDQYQFLNSDEDTPEAERLSASEKATEFASWVERQNYTEDQAETVKEALRYWQMIPAEASEKILLAQEYGVSDSSRKAAAEEIDRLKGDGNSVTQDMAAEALENMPGLDNRERAILWQLQNKSWKWNKNPFDKRVGREVYDRMHEEDEA